MLPGGEQRLPGIPAMPSPADRLTLSSWPNIIYYGYLILPRARDHRSPGKSRFMTSATKTTSKPTPKTIAQLSLLRACVWKMLCMNGM